ncbi:MAG: hypothetical protein ACI4RD_08600 [Kiritimatiellia bacterium]
MNKLISTVALAFLTGCCAYSQLGRDVGGVRVDGLEPVATYEVVNVAYRLLGLLPLTAGETWKEGPYSDNVGSMRLFGSTCDLDDNLRSVAHACEIVGGDDIIDVTGRVDEYSGWSWLLIKKRIVKTSCVIVKRLPSPAPSR